MLASEWETWLAGRQADASRSPLPAYILKEVEAYLRCGILDQGFLILACAGCAQLRPLAFSCKHRGICPSCGAKRGAEISTHLVDHVLPKVAYRQWVVTFPYTLRYWLAASRELTSRIHRRVTAMIQLYYAEKATERGIQDPLAGGVTFVQRFGSALNLTRVPDPDRAVTMCFADRLLFVLLALSQRRTQRDRAPQAIGDKRPSFQNQRPKAAPL